MKSKKYLSILLFGLFLGSLAPVQTIMAAAKVAPKVAENQDKEAAINSAFANGDVNTLKKLGVRDSMLRLRIKYPTAARELDENAIKEIESIIGYTFQNKDLLIQALTAQAKNPNQNYVGLKYLGNAILESIITEMLVENYPNAAYEGEFARMRETLVNHEPMAALCVYLGLHEYIQDMAKEIPISTLSDTIEFLIYAVYKDANYKIAREFVLKFFLPMIKDREQMRMGSTIIDLAKRDLKIAISYDSTSPYIVKLNRYPEASKVVIPHSRYAKADQTGKDNPPRLASYLAQREFIETALPVQYKKQLVRLAIDDDYQPLDIKLSPQEEQISGVALSAASTSGSSSQLPEPPAKPARVKKYSKEESKLEQRQEEKKKYAQQAPLKKSNNASNAGLNTKAQQPISKSKSIQKSNIPSNSQSSSSKSTVIAKAEIPKKQAPNLQQKKVAGGLTEKQIARIDTAFEDGQVNVLKSLNVKNSMLHLRMKYQIPGKKLSASAIEEIENIIGYTFENKDLLRQALTSRTKNPHRNYEAFEFLGDKILDATIAKMLHENYPKAQEGQLSRMRDALVSQEPLAALCVYLGLHEYLQDTVKEIPISTLCDIIESLIGVLDKDGGQEITESFILRFFLPMIADRQPSMTQDIIQQATTDLGIDISYDPITSYLDNIKKYKKGSNKTINPRMCKSSPSANTKTDPKRLACYLADRDFIKTQLPNQYKKRLVRLAIDADYQPLEESSDEDFDEESSDNEYSNEDSDQESDEYYDEYYK